MRLFAAMLVLLQCIFPRVVPAAEQHYFTVVVAEPYIEMHTGPGRGYPVFHVVDRGNEIEVIKRRTDWFKVRTARGKEGWVNRAEMELTLTSAGEATQFAEAGLGEFS